MNVPLYFLFNYLTIQPRNENEHMRIWVHKLSYVPDHLKNGIHQIVIRTLSRFYYLCQQLAYIVLSRIFQIADKINELIGSYQEYPAKSVGKQEEEFLIAALVKSWQNSLSEN
jgi:hypothetical protein